MNYKGKRLRRIKFPKPENMILLALILVVLSIATIAVVTTFELIDEYKAKAELESRQESKVIYSEPGTPIPTACELSYDSVVKSALETDPTLDYDWEYILCMVAAEIQTGSKENQMALAQCVRNTSERDGRSIGQILWEDYSAKPCDPYIVSDSIKDTCYRIFVLHETVIPTNVEVMYSTSGGFYSNWHEQQQFEFQIESIRYFSLPIYNAA